MKQESTEFKGAAMPKFHEKQERGEVEALWREKGEQRRSQPIRVPRSDAKSLNNSAARESDEENSYSESEPLIYLNDQEQRSERVQRKGLIKEMLER